MTNANETKTSFDLEKFLFGFTRMFALGGSIIAFIGVVVLLFSLFGSGGGDSFVSFSELRPSQQTEKADSAPPEIKVKIPENVKKYLSGEENVKILYGWIKSLDKRDQEDFVENLSLIITQAENKNEKVIDIVNDYKTAKLSKLQKTEFGKYEKIARKGTILGAMFGLILFIALMSLILVMLAVERNTRKLVNN